MTPPAASPPPDVAGLPVDEATQRCRDGGWEIVRTLEPGAVITLEFRPNRVNLTVEHGTVTQVHVG